MGQHRKQLDHLFSRITRQKANSQEQSFFWQWLWRLNVSERTNDMEKEERGELASRLWATIDKETQQPVSHRSFRKPFAAAAAVILMAVAGWLWMSWHASERNTQRYVFSSDVNTIRELTLPDSTIVVLNYGSSLEYSAAYNDSERRVTLLGEGYFNVRQNSRNPFIVVAGGLEVQALGTAFNIEARDRERETRVALTEGSVAVHCANSQVPKSVLYPGQLLRYERAGSQLTTTTFSTNVTAWTSGGFSFNGIPLTEALDRLGEHYGLRLRYNAEKLASKTVTASFNKTSWENVLSNVLFAHDLNYVVKDSIILIQ